MTNTTILQLILCVVIVGLDVWAIPKIFSWNLKREIEKCKQIGRLKEI